MKLRELMAKRRSPALNEAELHALRDSLHEPEGADAPLLVRTFTVIGTWIGACMAAMLFAAMELYEVPPIGLLVSLALLAGALRMSRDVARGLVKTQVIWAMGIAAVSLIGATLLEMDVNEGTVALIWALMCTFTLLLVRVPSFQIASAICIVIALLAAGAEFDVPMYPLWVALPVAATACAAWLYETQWAPRLGSAWAGLAYGFPIAVAGAFGLAGLVDDRAGGLANEVMAPLSSLFLLALIAWTLWRTRHELRAAGDDPGPRAYAVGLVCIVVSLAARQVPGLSLALLWLLISHARRSRGLQAVAMVQLASFLFFFYYQLDTSLLLKSLWVLSTGAVVLVGAFWSRPTATASANALPEPRSGIGKRLAAAALLSALAVGVVAASVANKERVLASGKRVLLPLAPTDPRSLMQGDYMVLRYQLANEARDALGHLDASERHGHMIIDVDGEGVGHFARMDDGAPLTAGQLRVEFRRRHNWRSGMRIGAESWFFEEGSASLYARAAFGELAVAPSGELVLVGLRDAKREPLGVQLHPPAETMGAPYKGAP